jgi:hypothetical protein
VARKKYQSRAKQPYLFEVDGVDFDTVRRIPGASFVDFIRQLRGFQDGGRSIEAVGELGANIYEMFDSVMEPEEFGRFWKWAKSPDGPDFEMLVEILSDMVADDTDRPTGRPSRSGRGPRSTGATSTDD